MSKELLLAHVDDLARSRQAGVTGLTPGSHPLTIEVDWPEQRVIVDAFEVY
jgi:hypothetical protein